MSITVVSLSTRATMVVVINNNRHRARRWATFPGPSYHISPMVLEAVVVTATWDMVEDTVAEARCPCNHQCAIASAAAAACPHPSAPLMVMLVDDAIVERAARAATHTARQTPRVGCLRTVRTCRLVAMVAVVTRLVLFTLSLINLFEFNLQLERLAIISHDAQRVRLFQWQWSCWTLRLLHELDTR